MRSVACGSSLSGFLAYKEEFSLRAGDGRTPPFAAIPPGNRYGEPNRPIFRLARLAVEGGRPRTRCLRLTKVRGLGCAATNACAKSTALSKVTETVISVFAAFEAKDLPRLHFDP
jgi:hypothetical protein